MHPGPLMLLALIPGLTAVALFVGTLLLTPPSKSRATLLPPEPATRKA